jgi:stage II sporulation protein P
MPNLPLGIIVLVLAAALFYLGVAHRVLDRLRLTDRAAFLILGALVLGGLLPTVQVAPTLSVDLGGALIPLGVAAYLVFTADTRAEKIRSVLAAFVVAGVVWWSDKLLPFEPGALRGPVDLDPIFVPGLVAAIVAYITGRSRRGAFVGATGGVVLTDVASALENLLRGVRGAVVAVGGGGVFDTVVLSGLLAVVLAEVVGEAREWLHRRSPRAKSLMTGPGTAALGLTMGILAAVLTWQAWPVVDGWEEGRPGSYRVMVDEEGNMVMSTSRRISRGDQFISSGNLLYEVVRVKGRVARAVCHGTVDLEAEVTATPVSPGENTPRVSIYHTHNAESYVRSDGADSIYGRGGIHEVGSALAQSLAAQGTRVRYSEDLHLPHDRGAYRRSRSTAISLLAFRPHAIFDVHRDALPQPEYAARVSGDWVTQIMIVVGQQNANALANREFAQRLKAVADRLHPDLVRGIFFARGNYNQDVLPRALLLEVGSHTNARESAERGAVLFGEVVSEFFRSQAATGGS